MPSVSELLAVLENQKSPFVSLLEGAAGGYASAQQNRLENAKRLMEIDQMRQEQEQKKQMMARQLEEDRKTREFIAGQMENKIQADKGTVQVPGTSPIRSERYKQTVIVETDPKTGLSSRKQTFETEDTTPKDVSYQAKEYKDSKGVPRIGAFNPSTGKLIMSPDDPPSYEKPTAPPSVQFIGTQGGAPVLFNPKTGKMEKGSLPGEGPLTSTTQTEGQANAKLYAKRMEEADTQINALSSKTILTSVSAGVQDKVPNIIQSKDIQLFKQAKRNFLNAVLRRESGAVISPTEFADGNKQYFPVMGDSDEVVAQKAANRKTALAGLRNAAGEASPTVTPQPQSGATKEETPTERKARLIAELKAAQR